MADNTSDFPGYLATSAINNATIDKFVSRDEFQIFSVEVEKRVNAEFDKLRRKVSDLAFFAGLGFSFGVMGLVVGGMAAFTGVN